MITQRRITIFLIIASFILFDPVHLWCQTIDTTNQLSELRNEPESHDLWLGVGYSIGLDRSNKVIGIQQYTISIGGYSEKTKWVQFNSSYLHTPIQKTSNPVYLIDNGVSMLEFGVEGKLYSQSPYSFLGHYFSFGIDAAYAFWNYSNNINAVDISGAFDQVWGVDLHLGTGFIIGRLLPLSANLDITPGVVLWLSDSHQGLSNFVLPVYYYLKVRISLSYSITSW
jgi:hypothetical protein